MDNSAFDIHTLGLVMVPIGLLNLGVGTVLTRHPKFPPWLGAVVQYAGIGLVPAGAILYFQPWGDQMALQAVGLIFMIVLALMVIRLRRAWHADKGNAPQ